MATLICKAISLVLGQLSGEFKTFLIAQLKEWKIKAADTKTPWDDLVADFLLRILE